MKSRNSKAALKTSAAILVLFCTSAAWAQTKTFDIPSEDAGKSIPELARQAGIQIVAPGEQLHGVVTPAVHGNFDVHAALAAMLKGTNVRIASDDGQTIVLTVPEKKVQAASNEGVVPRGASDTSIETVVVTGTHIRGAASLSPLIQATHDEIVAKGYSRLDEYVQSLPEAFSGGGASATSNGAYGSTVGSPANNYAFSSGINLLGLGTGATLTLLNGNRLVNTSEGTSVDISRIPLSAVERIDIVTDGASATYGADAVAGVANIITRKSFDGFEAGARVDSIAGGKSPNYGAYALGGFDWGSGNLVADYDYEKDNPLLASKRSFAADLCCGADLLPRTETSNGYVSLSQSLRPDLSFSANALVSRRTYYLLGTNAGAAPAIATYGGGDEYSVDGTLEYAFAPSWTASLSGSVSHGREIADLYYVGFGILVPDSFRYTNANAAAQLSGDLVQLPAGPLKTAFGYEYFSEGYVNGKTVNADRTVNSGYGEFLIPILSSDQMVPLIKEFVVNIAGRYDGYSDFGGTFNPKYSARWTVTDDLALRASYGTSYRTPTLQFLHPSSQSAYVFDYPAPTYPGGKLRTLFFGNNGNPNLTPERATTLTAGVTYTPSLAPNLSLGLDYFDIDFTNRIVRLTDAYPFAAALLTPSEYGQFLVISPSLAQVNQAIATAPVPVRNLTPSNPLNPATIQAIANLGFVNASIDHPTGLNFRADYHLDLDIGRLGV